MGINTAALVLAAGQASRFGAIKQLANLNGLPMIIHALARLEGLSLQAVYVVLGANDEAIQVHLPATVTVVHAPDWGRGMGHSLACGIEQLPDDINHVLVTLCDQVAIEQGDYQRLLQRSHQHPEKIIASDYGQRMGVPAIFCRSDFCALTKLSGDKGARDYLQQQIARLQLVFMPNARTDIDTQDDLIQWQENRQRSGHDPLQTE
ncbi:nucleotidyltransferase family protein [Aliiglaciecola sp. CAU 1673]|uniref:nucleotidyltransferase family protein n=1 Tax=Aliiglaciecola sp. CAU 1673 TaxID=3032595 RepID=UPI0023D98EF2|nr:nucleotidyltransferase family protein [Aliiglaciecola sp. CAU 1673]MDF2177257.1 nucleotidyltransferase family protein [Aliiglaciecola sp. CAU 1673]